jgi:hypothetical protein
MVLVGINLGKRDAPIRNSYFIIGMKKLSNPPIVTSFVPESLQKRSVLFY